MPDEVKPPAKAPRTQALREELEAERDRLREEMRPYRELYERHVNDPKYVEARRKIKELSGRLSPVETELAALARAGGARGVRAEPGTYESDK